MSPTCGPSNFDGLAGEPELLVRDDLEVALVGAGEVLRIALGGRPPDGRVVLLDSSC